MNTLTDLAKFYGTDKGATSGRGCKAKNYTQHYEQFFQNIKDRIIKLLEIGVAEGRSLRMWQSYFSNGLIYGIDIKKECKKYEKGVIKIFIGSQNNINFLKEVGDSGGLFDIIVDDGSHKYNDIRTSFLTLFPYLKADGYYCIEDLHALSSGEFQSLVALVLNTKPTEVHLYPSLVIVRKIR